MSNEEFPSQKENTFRMKLNINSKIKSSTNSDHINRLASDSVSPPEISRMDQLNYSSNKKPTDTSIYNISSSDSQGKNKF
ncbi:hypothetical protein AYI70_g10455 [Smittium culicis]|uniref:Uncharacterized protein n=1 Tax=Smittium culicis TaxID=133412 RepID=A0A1R1X6F5_9FUNG|nr:hypothetical protein AYI70_g10455 [Smittium culicis]